MSNVVALYGENTESTDETISAGQKDDDFLLTAKGWWKRDVAHSAPWRKEAFEDYEFIADRTISEEDRKKLAAEMRPSVSFNRIAPIVDAISGLEIQNRQETRFIPRTMGDVQVNEVLTSAGKFFVDDCDAEDEDSDAFRDTVICGMGWTESRLDHDEDPEGRYIRERIDPLEMVWDCSARKYNLADAKRFWRVREMPTAEAKAMFPDFLPFQLHAHWATDLGLDKDDPHQADKSLSYSQEERPKADPGDTVRIVHLQWCETEHSVEYVDPITGQLGEMTEADAKKAKKRFAELGIKFRSRRKTKKCWYQVFIGSELLGPREKNLCPDHSTWECITGKRDRNKGTFYGIVRMVKDPQRWANKWLSQALHILNLNAKGGVMAERGAFENDRDAEATWADPSKFTWVKPNALQTGKIQPKTQPGLPQGPEKFLELAISSIRDASGVNLELLGLRDAQQAGVLEQQRKQAGMTILAQLFDNLRRYRKRTGRTLLYYITNHLSDGRLVRIVGEEQEQYIPLLRQDPTVTRFDVIVDESPTSPNQKEQIWGMLLQLMPMLKGILPPQAWLALAKYSPLPSSVIQEVGQKAEEAMKQQGVQPNPEMMKLEASIKAEQAKQQIAAEGKQAEVVARTQEQFLEMEIMREKSAADIQVLREKVQADIDAMREKAIADIELSREKAFAEMQIKREVALIQASAEVAAQPQALIVAE